MFSFTRRQVDEVADDGVDLQRQPGEGEDDEDGRQDLGHAAVAAQFAVATAGVRLEAGILPAMEKVRKCRALLLCLLLLGLIDRGIMPLQRGPRLVRHLPASRGARELRPNRDSSSPPSCLLARRRRNERRRRDRRSTTAHLRKRRILVCTKGKTTNGTMYCTTRKERPKALRPCWLGKSSVQIWKHTYKSVTHGL